MNKNKEKNNFLFPMVIMSILFFMVGFITTMNNSLIDFLLPASGCFLSLRSN